MTSGVDVDKGDYDNRTPVHLAASEGHHEILVFLIKEGGLKNINPIDRWGMTPLDYAIKGKFTESIKVLQENGGQKASII